MALINDEIFKIFWTSYYHNIIYGFKTKRRFLYLVVEKIQNELHMHIQDIVG